MASGYARHANDWYQEPDWIVDALLRVERFEGPSLDPSCGEGNIPKRLRAAGLECDGSDIADRGFGTPGVDFFALARPVANIVSNPPYGPLQKYIEHALSLTSGKVAVLARLAFLEGQRRRPFFEWTPLARVWVSTRRVSMPPGGTGIEAKGGAIAYAWFVWDHAFRGSAPTIGWL